MSYKIGFDGAVSVELKRLLQSVENRVNGLSMHAQASDVGATTVASGTPTQPSTDDKPCPDGVKIGHLCVHFGVVVIIAIVGGAAAGYLGGRLGAKSVKR
jgi:hypothetical protein